MNTIITKLQGKIGVAIVLAANVFIICMGRANACGQNTISPAPGTTFSNTSVTFTWSGSADEYWIYAGQNQGTADIINSGSLGTNRQTSIAIESNGQPLVNQSVWIRLWCRTGAQWNFADYQYTSAPEKPILVNPLPGTLITNPSINFTWTHPDPSSTVAWVIIGSTLASSDIDSSGLISNTSTYIVQNIPLTYQEIFVRIYCLGSAGWTYDDFRYPTASLPQMISPTPTTTLSSTSVTFTWEDKNPNTIVSYLYAGTNFGWSDLAYSGSLPGGDTSYNIANLPKNGQQIYVRIWILAGNHWVYNDFIYTSPSIPELITPVSGSTISKSEITFELDDNGTAVQSWVLLLGATPGYSDIFYGYYFQNERQITVSQIPYFRLQGKLHARLWTYLPSGWTYSDYEYNVPTPDYPSITSPNINTIMEPGSVTFNWGDHGTGITDWKISVGTSSDPTSIIDNVFLVNKNSFTTHLPRMTESHLYVNLGYLVSSGWEYQTFVYNFKNGSPNIGVRTVVNKVRKNHLWNFSTSIPIAS